MLGFMLFFYRFFDESEPGVRRLTAGVDMKTCLGLSCGRKWSVSFDTHANQEIFKKFDQTTLC